MARSAKYLIGLLAFTGCGSTPRTPAPLPEASAIQVARQADGYEIREGERRVLFYQLTPKSINGEYERSNYVHPLYGLDGEILTEDFPKDHLHHRGVFWAWHQVFIGDIRAGDPWVTKDFSWDVQESAVIETGDGVTARIHWKSLDFQEGREPIVEETTLIRVHPSEDDRQRIDFDIQLAALQDGVRLGGSEDDKGYGGFSVRTPVIESLTFTGPEGPVTAQNTPVAPAPWMDFSAEFAGPGKTSGIAVVIDPTTIGFPQPWILRALPSRSMQNPVWPGRHAVPLPRGEPVRLRYTLIVHRGDAAALSL